MEAELKSILDQAKSDVKQLNSLADYEAFKAHLVGSNGLITQLTKKIKDLPSQDRPLAGKLINQAKQEADSILKPIFSTLEAQALTKQLGPSIDPSLPAPDGSIGSLHPLTQTRRKISDIFRKIGFSIAEGPEAESEWYCFDALNTPEDHPARHEQDTLYFPQSISFGNINKKDQERFVLRTHTSSVQIRTLQKSSPPLRIIAPGRCFRRDTVDATHSANFHQVEGLYVDKNVSVKDLKATLDFFVHELFGKEAKTRFRPSFFPFTEPSFEMDMLLPNLGKLSNQWIEVLGCGLVDPEVFKSVNLDPNAWSGFAFGMGLERIAMLIYEIDDIRYFYNNDYRFLKQFN